MNEHSNVQSNSARLGANHGYLIHGDVARLHADVEGLHSALAVESWALQLWACEMPHTGGPVAGIKVAETMLTGTEHTNTQPLRLDAAADAFVPGGQRDYAMVLVLASGANGHYQVHDFANYPDRQRFMTPHLDGSVGYHVDGDQVVLQAEAIRSPRSADNISGSLSLELRAVAQPYLGGSIDGPLLGRADLGRLAGQSVLGPIEVRVPFTAPVSGRWEVVMTLREWTDSAGYVTRDHARFAIPYVADSEPVTAAIHTEDAVPAAEETHAQAVAAPVAAPVAVPVVASAATPVAVPAATPVAADRKGPAPDNNAKTVQPDRAVAAAPARTAAGRTESAKVSVNQATAEQIAAVKGLSPKLAKEIVRGRPYASLSALLDVRGIGPKLLEKLRPYLSI